MVQVTTIHVQSAEEAGDELLRLIWEAYHRGGVTVFQIPPGLGKTRAAGQFLASMRHHNPDQRCRLASPTRALAQETANRNGRGWDVRAGRNDATCAQFDRVQRWMRLGMGGSACLACPLHPRNGRADACSTPDRLRKTGGSTFTTHAHLWLTGARDGEVVIIDEDPTPTAVATHHIPYHHLATVLGGGERAHAALARIFERLAARAEGRESGPLTLDRIAIDSLLDGLEVEEGALYARPVDEALYEAARAALREHGDAAGVLEGIENSTPPRRAWEALYEAWQVGGAWYACTLTPSGLDVTAPRLLDGVEDAKAVIVLDATANVGAVAAVWGADAHVVRMTVDFPGDAQVWLIPMTLSTQQHHTRAVRETMWGTLALANEAGYTPDKTLFVGHKRHTPTNANTASSPTARFAVPSMPQEDDRSEAWRAEFEALSEMGCAWTHHNGTLARGSNAWEDREAVILSTWATPRAAWVALGEALRWASLTHGVAMSWREAWEAARWTMLVAPVIQAAHRVRQTRSQRSLTAIFCAPSPPSVDGDAPPQGLVDVAAAAADQGLLPPARIVSPEMARALITGHWSGRAAVDAAHAAAEARGWALPGAETVDQTLKGITSSVSGGMGASGVFCAGVPSGGAPSYRHPCAKILADVMRRTRVRMSDYARRTRLEPSTGTQRRLELVAVRGPTRGRPQSALTDSHAPVAVHAIAAAALRYRDDWDWVEVCGVRVTRDELAALTPTPPAPTPPPPKRTAPRPTLVLPPPPSDPGGFGLWLCGDDPDAEDPSPPPSEAVF